MAPTGRLRQYLARRSANAISRSVNKMYRAAGGTHTGTSDFKDMLRDYLESVPKLHDPKGLFNVLSGRELSSVNKAAASELFNGVAPLGRNVIDSIIDHSANRQLMTRAATGLFGAGVLGGTGMYANSKFSASGSDFEKEIKKDMDEVQTTGKPKVPSKAPEVLANGSSFVSPELINKKSFENAYTAYAAKENAMNNDLLEIVKEATLEYNMLKEAGLASGLKRYKNLLTGGIKHDAKVAATKLSSALKAKGIENAGLIPGYKAQAKDLVELYTKNDIIPANLTPSYLDDLIKKTEDLIQSGNIDGSDSNVITALDTMRNNHGYREAFLGADNVLDANLAGIDEMVRQANAKAAKLASESSLANKAYNKAVRDTLITRLGTGAAGLGALGAGGYALGKDAAIGANMLKKAGWHEDRFPAMAAMKADNDYFLSGRYAADRLAERKVAREAQQEEAALHRQAVMDAITNNVLPQKIDPALIQSAIDATPHSDITPNSVITGALLGGLAGGAGGALHGYGVPSLNPFHDRGEDTKQALIEAAIGSILGAGAGGTAGYGLSKLIGD